MSEAPFNAPKLVGPDGKPVSSVSKVPERCPACGAGADKRKNSAGFGPPVIVCDSCGWYYEGATE